MGIIDSHAHYENPRYDEDRDALLSSMPAMGVDAIINVAWDVASSHKAIELAETYPFIYATVGVHPHEAKTLTEAGLETLKNLCAHPKVVGFGEIGLDYHYDFSPRDVQRHWFKRQLALAYELGMPVAIHSREADEDVFDVIESSPVRRGVLHSFSGNADLAQAYVDLGFYLGISGVVTFDKTGKLQAVIEKIPLDKLLLETDAPYLTPKPFRGKRNESPYLSYVADAIAAIKGIDAEAVKKQ
ncbi:MAG: TatD family hydrolase, partial [Defluviitaleaceae bacterium]|nr:TatD family hydrolase [Defluviitaleaceae bacterium]